MIKGTAGGRVFLRILAYSTERRFAPLGLKKIFAACAALRLSII